MIVRWIENKIKKIDDLKNIKYDELIEIMFKMKTGETQCILYYYYYY